MSYEDLELFSAIVCGWAHRISSVVESLND